MYIEYKSAMIGLKYLMNKTFRMLSA